MFNNKLTIDEFLKIPQFSINKIEKKKVLLPLLQQVHKHHILNCEEYKKITESIFPNASKIQNISDLPFIPVSLFKNYDLKSITQEDVFKVLTSSGTTGQVPSRIYLDKKAASLQQFSLSKIMTHILGNERIPMLIVDSHSVLKDRTSFSARGAGILGLSVFGKKHHYVLDDDFQLDEAELYKFIEQFNGKKILIFGFTFMIWQYLMQFIFSTKIDLSNAILIHSGGWKKLQEMAVDNLSFKKSLKDKFNIQPHNIYNFYGMIEQIGSVFLENEKNFLHCPNFSDVIIRNPKDFSVQPNGTAGLVQVISVLPNSYPGHSLLTEDIGVIEGEDIQNSWQGKYFRILGRAKKAELRGCSDTFKKS
jgi:phenylacetate-coenzyme A ligase PaaK-like adenylate-forming protein